MIFRTFDGRVRVMRLPLWALVLGGVAAVALVATFAMVALGLALVAVPVLLAGGWLARLFDGRRRDDRVVVERSDAPGWRSPGRGNGRTPEIIDATWEDVTDRKRR